MVFSDHEDPNERVDEQAITVLRYPEQRAQAICSSSLLYKTPEVFAGIEGSKGSILVARDTESKPGYLIVRPRDGEEKRLDFEAPGWGFLYEAYAVALDIQAERLQNQTCPLATTQSILERMDKIIGISGLPYKEV
ncbi:hypothetical protein CC80DRAFT_542987 [Byssothecium circinans]|uniref:Gfo/Idh/MocA-like oxidoreductase C-terminal domain-containing protein n=1 Tax=Byssothecium circinans TaxID=147558 RepID=A0A6A5UBB0_9PLEO|nr:hypothetical protein CC80DRAFT_542987 [Byssothecium circinans]